MNKLKIIIKFLHSVLLYLMHKGCLNWLNDKTYLKLEYKIIMKRDLNLENPKTFDEKMQWLKLYNRDEKYIKMVDKYEAKKYVQSIIGKQYIIPTYGIYDRFEEIDFENLPNEFVLKPTHTSGDYFICMDKFKINKKLLKKQIKKWIKKNYYFIHREWPYKNVKPRILVEKFLRDKNNEDIKDYKFFCFNGQVKVCLVCSNRKERLNKTWFDANFNKIDLVEGMYSNDDKIIKPNSFEEMKLLAHKLSKNIPFVRVDFYSIDNNIFFGELTFFPGAGYEKFSPERWNDELGENIVLPVM